jgi:hypothetical protein
MLLALAVSTFFQLTAEGAHSLGDSHWAAGPNLACDGHYVTHLRTSSGRYWVPEPGDLASTKTDMQPGGLARRSNTCAVAMSCFRGIAVVGHQNLLHDVL